MVRGLAASAALVGATVVAGWGTARAAVARIERNPDPYPPERLIAEPEGEEMLITRPDGTLLRALVAGEGSPVVLAHGYTATLAEWNLVWDDLIARGFRVIAFDQRGHGRSTLGSAGSGSEPMAADCAAILEHFNVSDGVLVGHSMGGFVAIRAVPTTPTWPGDYAVSCFSQRGAAASSTGRRKTDCRFRCWNAASCRGCCVPEPVRCCSVPPSAASAPHRR